MPQAKSDSYEKHFGLSASPFKSAPGAGFFYKSPGVENVLAALLDPKAPQFIQITGPEGVGKTSLLKRLPLELRPEAKVVLILNPHLKLAEILAETLKALDQGHKCPPSAREEELMGYFQNRVSDLIEDGRRIVLAVDDAHDLSAPALAELWGLLRLEPSWTGRAALILAGREPLPQLEGQTPLILTLAPLSRQETAAYMNTRLTAAGSLKNPFNSGALQFIQEHSKGLPGLVNPLAERGLMAAWLAGRREVSAAQLSQAKESLDKPLLLNPDLYERGAAEKRPGRPRSRKAGRGGAGRVLLMLALVGLVVFFAWRLLYDAPAAGPELPAAPTEAAGVDVPAEPADAVPAGDNSPGEAAGVAGGPALAAPPAQILNLPQNALALAVNLDSQTGRLWQGNHNGVGLKAEIQTPDFSGPGLYLFGQPRGGAPLIFHFPPARDLPREAAKAVWPKVATLLPQNILPVVAGRPADFAGAKDDALRTRIATLVKVWVQSQQYRFPDSMADLYANSFQFFELGQPEKTLSLDDFRAALNSEARTSGDVNLAISEPLIIRDPAKDSLVWAVFNLKYDSRLRHDMGVRVLVFERALLNRDDWRIAAELWLPEHGLRER